MNNLSAILPGSRLIGLLSSGSEPLPEGLLPNLISNVIEFIGSRLSPSHLAASNVMASISVLNYVERTRGNMGLRELDQEGRLSRQRIVMAIFGGISLIGPMLIKSTNPSLITVSVATFVFALALAVGAIDSGGKDVLGATAAYAAVLVVFIGTSS